MESSNREGNKLCDSLCSVTAGSLLFLAFGLGILLKYGYEATLSPYVVKDAPVSQEVLLSENVGMIFFTSLMLVAAVSVGVSVVHTCSVFSEPLDGRGRATEGDVETGFRSGPASNGS